MDHLVHEAFGGDVCEPGAAEVLEHVAADRVHQMGLAKTHSAVDEERVVGPRGRLGHSPCRRVRKLVRGTDDESVEGVAGVQAGTAGDRCGNGVCRLLEFVGRERRGRRLGRSVGDELDHALLAQFGERLRNQTSVMLP